MTPFSMQKLGCNAELIVDEFGEKLLEELDYAQEARNIEACPHPERTSMPAMDNLVGHRGGEHCDYNPPHHIL